MSLIKKKTIRTTFPKSWLTKDLINSSININVRALLLKSDYCLAGRGASKLGEGEPYEGCGLYWGTET